ncbi:DNA polymerase phi-domain-containing protein [Tricharina praecox]|uniref:DNA polymerase phi-domain-containing protein n=1 Tax=Tricharina praecox TaxID=43433 RepID=UPI0022201D41|nr:DNA polymerase phi-domain-containing protein [Tricharina praecox]KAI5856466.1 DNA polymerase phi-domain-containing protein [Tricharina praecox]
MSLSLYKPLGDNNEAVRLQAAQQLAGELSELLAGEHTEKSKADVDYALKRLTRGIGSGRDSARPGFAVVLTEFLTNLAAGGNAEKWGISLDDAVTAVVKNTTPQGHSSGQEERDAWLGRLFGLQSLVQSNILFSTEDAVTEKYPAVLDLLFEVANKKPWLMESSAWTIAASVPRWPQETSAKAAEITYAKLISSGMAKTGEGVGIWLALRAHLPEVTPPKDVWSKGSPLVTGNLATLARVLKESGAKEEGIKTKGSWNPKLGFVWESILNVYFSEEAQWKAVREGKPAAAEWAEFWRAVVDESLFSSSSSEERKFWGFLFFLKALDRITTPPDLTAMFSKNFMRCMTNQLADVERYLNKAAAKVSRALIAKSESAAWTAPVIFKQLVANNGSPNFDQLTRTKTVDKVLCSADEAGLVEVVKVLGDVISNPLGSLSDVEDGTKVAEVRRQWAADQILSAIRSGKTVKSESWLKKVIELFATYGYFDVVDKKKKPVVPVTTISQGMFRARLMSSLTHLITLTAGVDNSESWPYLAVKTLAELEEKKNSYKFVVEFDEKIAEALEKATTTVEKLRKKRASDPADIQLLSFELLYSLIILQVYNGESDALSVLEDLQSIQKKILKLEAKAKKSKKGKTAVIEDEEMNMDMDPSAVLVDILLSFLSKPSMLLKRLAQTVFTSFCGSITREGLERCFEVLETKEGLDGQATLFDNENDDEEEEDDDDMEDLDSDVEMLSNPEGDDDGEDSDVEFLSASESESESESVADRNEEEARKLEAALQTVLSAPAGEDSDSDADLDDEAMLALDAQISNIFAKRKEASSKKSQKKEAKELIVHFKAKILELLEIFAKTAPRSPLALEMLLPCLVLSRSTRDQKLQEKAFGVVRTFAHNSKREGLPVLSGEDVDRAWELLEAVHVEAGKGGAKGRRATCSSASILVVRTLAAADGDTVDTLTRVTAVYGATMARWVADPKLGIDNGFFSDLVGWAGSVRGKFGKEEVLAPTVEVAVGKGKEKRKRGENEDEVVEVKTNGGGKNKKRKKGGKKGRN